MIKKYLFNLFLGLDQMLNCVLAGDPDETVSSRLGRVKRANGGTYPKTRPWGYVLDKMLDKIDPGHSIDSIEEDEGHDGIRDRRNGIRDRRTK